jgi:hypothetical protein
MAGIGADLKTWITASTSCNAVIAGRMHQNNPPQDTSRPFIWYMRTSENEELTLDGVGGLRKAQFDVECVTTNPSTNEVLADRVKTRLHGKTGTFGASTVQGSFVEDHSDDYAPKSVGGDSGLHVAAFNLTVWYTT